MLAPLFTRQHTKINIILFLENFLRLNLMT
jgi:hypothetical protein